VLPCEPVLSVMSIENTFCRVLRTHSVDADGLWVQDQCPLCDLTNQFVSFIVCGCHLMQMGYGYKTSVRALLATGNQVRCPCGPRKCQMRPNT
jgi:hypothetical protein